jgi:hypothetical protein
VARWFDDEINRAAAFVQAAGMRAKVSSIQVNGSAGNYDKLRMARNIMNERYGIDPNDRPQCAPCALRVPGVPCAFAADPPHDAPMFAACGERYAGLAQHLLRNRRQLAPC